MMRKTNRLVSLFLLIFCWSCGGDPETLHKAEQCMVRRPDSALLLLKSLPGDPFFLPGERAKYALLMSEALDQNDVKQSSDSLIETAAKFYGMYQPLQAGKAWFYYSRVADNRCDAAQQAARLLRAQEFAEQAKDPSLLALIYSDKALMLRRQKLYAQSTDEFRQALAAFRRYGAVRSQALCLFYIADNFMCTSQPDSALCYSQQTRPLMRRLREPVMWASYYKNIAGIYFQMKRYSRALALYRKIPLTGDTLHDSNRAYLLAQSFLSLHRHDSVAHYLRQVEGDFARSPAFLLLQQEFAEANHRYPEALRYASQAVAATDSVYHHRLTISLTEYEKRDQHQRLQMSNQLLLLQNSEKNNRLLIASLLIALLLLALVMGLLHYRRSKIAMERKNLFTQFEKEAEAQRSRTLKEKQQQLHRLLQQLLDEERQRMARYPEHYSASRLKSQPSRLLSFYQTLYATIDLSYPQLMERILHRFPTLTRTELNTALLILADFDSKTIATLFGTENASIDMRRSRLRKKLGINDKQSISAFLTTI